MKLSLASALLLLGARGDDPTIGKNNYQGCTSESSKDLPYCDVSLSIDERLDDLWDRVKDLDARVQTMSPQADLGNTCGCHTGGYEDAELPQYYWLVETNTNVASRCRNEGSCATTFPGPLNMGSSFNRTLWRSKGGIIGNEIRAFNNLGWDRVTGTDENPDLIGVTGYGPNINIARDPRFGRTSELPGEDPFHSGTYGAEMMLGMQEEDENGHPKMMAYLKHFTAYSTETNRGGDTYEISMHDLFDTYLPQYEKGFVEGGATGAMCSYNGINGVPSCANSWLLNDVLRGKWNMKDAHITTDCGAVTNLLHEPANAASNVEAVAMALNGGTDVEMGSTLFSENLRNATESGLVKEEDFEKSWRRTFRVLFKSGRFDPIDSIKWSNFGVEMINSTFAQETNMEAALQGNVLLKNDGLLPLTAGQKIAVVGPMFDARKSLLSSYAADDICFDQENTNYACITSLLEAVTENNVGGTTVGSLGVNILDDDESNIDAAVSVARDADLVILAVGQDKSVEQEGKDRTDTALPGIQEEFAKKILALNKPVAMVMVNGGAIAIDNLVDGPNAIVEGFNPNVKGFEALGKLLFGANRWGKLPVTMYPHSYIDEQEMTNYDMSKSPGRTYKYYQGEPLFEFGHGLSYTTFDLSCDDSKDEDNSVKIKCSLSNSGDVDGDEVVMVFHSIGDNVDVDHPVPIKQLRDFSREGVVKGGKKEVTFAFTADDIFGVIDGNGDKQVYSGTHNVVVVAGDKKVELQYTL